MPAAKGCSRANAARRHPHALPLTSKQRGVRSALADPRDGPGLPMAITDIRGVQLVLSGVVYNRTGSPARSLWGRRLDRAAVRPRSHGRMAGKAPECGGCDRLLVCPEAVHGLPGGLDALPDRSPSSPSENRRRDPLSPPMADQRGCGVALACAFHPVTGDCARFHINQRSHGRRSAAGRVVVRRSPARSRGSSAVTRG
jgi:hypothetical protein